MLEPRPRDFAGLIAGDKYMHLVSRAENSQVGLFVDAIQLMDAGAHAWAIRFGAGREVLEQWTQPGRIEIRLGEGTGADFKPSKGYELPERNRVAAARGFLEACFPGQPPPRIR